MITSWLHKNDDFPFTCTDCFSKRSIKTKSEFRCRAVEKIHMACWPERACAMAALLSPSTFMDFRAPPPPGEKPRAIDPFPAVVTTRGGTTTSLSLSSELVSSELEEEEEDDAAALRTSSSSSELESDDELCGGREGETRRHENL